MEDHAGATTSSGGAANRAEAERLLGIAEKLLQKRDLTGSREFAVLAQETDPLLEGSDQILAISDVFIAAEKRINNQYDWYSILGVESRSDADLIKKNYRRLALLLHPDKNRYHLADAAFKLVADAWAVLSNPSKKSMYDNELTLFSRVELGAKQTNQAQFEQQNKLPVRRSPRGPGGVTPNSAHADGVGGRTGSETRSSSRLSSFWTACPYCYILYEYPRLYEDCCLRCQNCQRAFHAAVISSLPPLVAGKEAYYCCWGFFPLGFSIGNPENGKNRSSNNNPNSGFPNWMPPMFSRPISGAVAPSTAATTATAGTENRRQGRQAFVDISDGGASAELRATTPTPTVVAGVAAAGTENRRQGRQAFMDFSDGGASAELRPTTPTPPVLAGVAPGSSMPRKRGRPRKNPL
ncbi:hypothetical protein Ancab_038297 [Ancistrocladus abbreviatus]